MSKDAVVAALDGECGLAGTDQGDVGLCKHDAPPPPVVSEIVLHVRVDRSMVSPLTAFAAA
jgi:hypothetical protein